jgi:hypothetical protein
MVFSKKPSSSGDLRNSLPSSVHVIHSLGLDFYYANGATPGRDPADLGYTASGFDIADKLVARFPDISALFPAGAKVSGCQADDGNYLLILGEQVMPPISFGRDRTKSLLLRMFPLSS